MRFVRFIGESELQVLIRDGEVRPIHNSWTGILGNGVVKKEPCLWLFPEKWRGYNLYQNDSPEDRLLYCSGIVADLEARLQGKVVYGHMGIHLDLPITEVVKDVQDYADPYGGWFDRIEVLEFLLQKPYRLEQVLELDFYEQQKGSGFYRSVSHLDKPTIETLTDWRKTLLSNFQFESVS